MKALAFVDLHGSKPALKRILSMSKKADIIICAGDFTIFSHGQKEILEKLDKTGKPVLVIHGNHEEEDELKKECRNLENCHFIHDSKFRLGNHLFIGWGGGGFSYTDKEFEKKAKRFSKWIKEDDRVVLVTHAPPYKTKIDKIGDEYAGNRSIRKFIEKIEPVLAVSGHLHECVGEDKIKITRVLNPGYKGKIINL